MKKVNNIQTSVLFDDSISSIFASSTSSNVIHKTSATPAISNDTKKSNKIINNDIKTSFKIKKFNVALSNKYNKTRFFMNENKFINIDDKIFHISDISQSQNDISSLM